MILNAFVFSFWSYLVLSWDGEVSAISRDAAEDVRHARFDTVIDEWDEDFDRGKVKKKKDIFILFRSANLVPLSLSLDLNFSPFLYK